MADTSTAAMYLRGTLGFHVECPLDDMAKRVSEEWHRRAVVCQEHRQQIADLQREVERLKADNEQLREAARPFLSLQSLDHSERIAGLVHRTYFDNLRTALDLPEPPDDGSNAEKG